EQADSVTLDPHKWFAQPFEAGCVLVREGRRLGDAFWIRPDYLQDVSRPDTPEVHFADHGLALTRRFRALKIWLSVKTLGLGWFRRLVEHGCNLAELMLRLLEQTGEFEVFGAPGLSILCFRYVPTSGASQGHELDALNRAICAEA